MHLGLQIVYSRSVIAHHIFIQTFFYRRGGELSGSLGSKFFQSVRRRKNWGKSVADNQVVEIYFIVNLPTYWLYS